ncbi:hypothetical protein JD292_04185 [Leucobacter sp. CSA2]|uniref:Uncharacterized protein n=1 Tax=Leucobacter edaphi TaxID=2796472 RepID=A0A934UXG1_9MICO|nr:hypothetical protein [Leucobacter edaphi]MBK0421278.1 hypothetical protein [Leucobacter edaphi]
MSKTSLSKLKFLAFAAAGFLATGAVAGTLGATVIANNSTPAHSHEQLPKYLHGNELGDGGLLAESITLVGKTGTYEFWRGKDRGGNVCAVVGNPSSQHSVFNCVREEDFKVHGAAGTFVMPNDGVERPVAYLLAPPDTDAAALQTIGFESVGADGFLHFAPGSVIEARFDDMNSHGGHVQILPPAPLVEADYIN